MRLAGFRAERLISVAVVQTVAFGLGNLLYRWTSWQLPAALLIGAVLLLRLRLGRLPWVLEYIAVGVAGLALVAQGAVLLNANYSLSAAMVVMLGLSVLSLPFLTADQAAYADAHELSDPVFGLVLTASAVVLIIRTDLLVGLGLWKIPLAAAGLLGAALYILDPFTWVRMPAVRRALGLVFTLPVAAAAISLGNFPTAAAWLAWTAAILLGDLRDLAEWRVANDRLQQQQQELSTLNAALAESEERFRIAFQHAPIGMAVVNTQSQIEQVNPSLCAMLGYTEGELTAMDISAITHPDDLATDMELARQIVVGEIGAYRIEKRYIHKDGRIRWGDLNVSVVRETRGETPYLLGQVQDITERKRLEERLREWADRDSLTGLHNRRRFLEELEWAVALWKRYGTEGAVILIDLDGFKSVNDSLGHHAGDQLLRKVADALRGEMRAADLYGRLGGDEFACFLGAVGPAEAMAVAGRLLQAIAAATRAAEFHAVEVTGSAGVAMLPQHATEVDDLLIKADMAMYQAKRSGKNQAVLYGPESPSVFMSPLD